jgi:hypothetical protein
LLVIVGLSAYQGGDEVRVAVLDEAGVAKQIPDERGVRFIPSGNKNLDQRNRRSWNAKLTAYFAYLH